MELDLTAASARDLADFYLTAPALKQPWLRANMVISQDGHLVDSVGSSRGLTSPDDLKALLTLRAISDAVLVGASTVRTEDYRPPVLAGDFMELNTKNPRLVVLSLSLNFDPTSRLFSRPENRPMIFTVRRSDEIWNETAKHLADLADLFILDDELNLPEIITTLRSFDLNNIVCEGGPKLLAQLHQQDLIDELDLTTSPVTVGPEPVKNCVTDMASNWNLVKVASIGAHQLNRYIR